MLGGYFEPEEEEYEEENEDDYTETDHPGRDKCDQLRAIRKKIAEANDIPFAPTECHHKGPCAGTCPVCDREIEYLDEQLQKKKDRGEKVNLIDLAEGEFLGAGIGSEQTIDLDDCAEGEFDIIQSFQSVTRKNGKAIEDTKVAAVSIYLADWGLPLGILNTLKRAEITTVGDLCNRTENEMRNIRSIYDWKALTDKMKEYGVHFRDEDGYDFFYTEYTHPGRDQCDEIRSTMRRIAECHFFPFEPAECHLTKPCTGICPENIKIFCEWKKELKTRADIFLRLAGYTEKILEEDMDLEGFCKMIGLDCDKEDD